MELVRGAWHSPAPLALGRNRFRFNGLVFERANWTDCIELSKTGRVFGIR